MQYCAFDWYKYEDISEYIYYYIYTTIIWQNFSCREYFISKRENRLTYRQINTINDN